MARASGCEKGRGESDKNRVSHEEMVEGLGGGSWFNMVFFSCFVGFVFYLFVWMAFFRQHSSPTAHSLNPRGP